MTRKPQLIDLCPAVITADSAEKLIDLCKKLKALGLHCPESAVTGDRYHIRLIARIPEELLLCSELSDDVMLFPASEAALAKLAEHERTVIAKNAVEILSGLPH